jgi:hypothetical protein
MSERGSRCPGCGEIWGGEHCTCCGYVVLSFDPPLYPGRLERLVADLVGRKLRDAFGAKEEAEWSVCGQ